MRNFVVISSQRAGSHMLMNLLNSHPDIHCNFDLHTGDVTEYGNDWAYDQGFSYNGDKDIELLGFLMKDKQYLYRTIGGRDTKVILLKRTNYLSHLLSYQLKAVLGCYEETGLTLEEASRARDTLIPVDISLQELCLFICREKDKMNDILSYLEDIDYLNITYEDLCRDPQQTIELVYKYLDIDSQPIYHTEGRGKSKIDQRHPSKAIKNYFDLKSTLIGCFK